MMRLVDYLHQDSAFPKELINRYDQQEKTEKLKVLRAITNLVTKQQKQGIFIEPVVTFTLAIEQVRDTPDV